MGDSQQPGDRSMQPRVSMDMSGSMQMEHIGYQPDYSVIANQRRKLRSVIGTTAVSSHSSPEGRGARWCASLGACHEIFSRAPAQTPAATLGDAVAC